MSTNEEHTDECVSCEKLREDLKEAYEWGTRWQQSEVATYQRLREEILRCNNAELTLRQVSEQRDELWVQLNTATE